MRLRTKMASLPWVFIRPLILAFTLVLPVPLTAAATPYTIASSVDFSVGGLDVRFLPVTSIDPGTLSAAPRDGVVSDPSLQDWLVVEVAVLGTSTVDLSALGVGNPISLAQGAGVLAGPGVTPSNIDATNPAPGTADTPLFEFAAFGSGTSDILVAAYAAGDLPGAGIPPFIPAGTVSFMVDNGTTVASTTSTVVGGVAIVPEPTVALLFCLGSAVLVSVRRSASERMD